MKKFTALSLALCAGVSYSQAPATWKSVGVGGGGAFFSPAFNPFSPNELTVACDMSGQYKTTTLGTAWNLVPFTTLQVGRNSPKVQFTSDPKIQFMIDATGEVGRPVKSIDGGATWKPLPVEPTGADAWYLFADPTTTTRLFVSDYSNLYFTKDGGAHWAKIATSTDGNGVQVSGAFFDGSRIFVGTNLGVFVSTNGATFSKLAVTGIPSTEQIVGFAAAKAGTTTRLIVVTLGAGDVYGGIQGDDHYGYKGVYALDYGGAAGWKKSVTGIAAGLHPFFVGMARGDINTVYLGGGSDAGVPVVLKSTTGGKAWTSVLTTAGNKGITTGWAGSGGDRDWGYDELAFGFDVCPTDAKRVAFTGFGFCHLTTDGGASWKQAYVSPTTQNPPNLATPKGKAYQGVGLENTAAWYVAWADANNVWGSFSDIRGARSMDGGKTWGFNYSGHTLNASYQVVVHPTTGAMYMATSSVHDMYESTHLTDASMNNGTGDVLVSPDKGKTWSKVGSIGKVVVGLALDLTNPKRLFATVASSLVGGVYVCQDVTKGAAATWTKLAKPPRTEGHAFNIAVLKDGTLVATYSGHRTSNFTDSSGVFVSTNGGQSWVDRSHPNMHWWTRDLTVDPNDATQKTWYAAVYSGWGGNANNRGGLYKTVDRGVSWKQILVLDRVGSCAVNPKNPKEVYATTEVQGLWYSVNATSASPSFIQVASYPFRQPQRVFFNPFKAGEVWVTSFGNGIRIGSSGPVP
ncbi:sialidase family protein [Fimbriimonas ginsengisoli]|uniref:BNR/Asp-box repeat protein n=1 Tax=Fimbriimonas ginsengisoli Gsoil 348 TaxID=661478 RepID=A0A068NXP2_FIMGI|nr:sialidase family protein [Fimbriimonas ginsengisoli]AIE87525.1 BNR/Asp-box repeat protein [Fimbriimonas ginsengisoli Gsoil 348]